MDFVELSQHPRMLLFVKKLTKAKKGLLADAKPRIYSNLTLLADNCDKSSIVYPGILLAGLIVEHELIQKELWRRENEEKNEELEKFFKKDSTELLHKDVEEITKMMKRMAMYLMNQEENWLETAFEILHQEPSLISNSITLAMAQTMEYCYEQAQKEDPNCINPTV